MEENSDLIRAMTTYYDLLRIESLSSKLSRYALSHNKVLFSLIIKYNVYFRNNNIHTWRLSGTLRLDEKSFRCVEITRNISLEKGTLVPGIH